MTRIILNFCSPIAFLVLVLSVMYSGCECAEYDDQSCEYCNEPQVCIDGFCVCDTVNYYNFAGYCEKKGVVTYRNMAINTNCLSDQMFLDSQYYDGFLIKYWIRYKVDSIYTDEDKLFGQYFSNPDGDSLSLQSTFESYKIKGTLCKGYFYCKNTANELHVDLYYRDINDFNNIIDSCSFKLYRDK